MKCICTKQIHEYNSNIIYTQYKQHKANTMLSRDNKLIEMPPYFNEFDVDKPHFYQPSI